MDQSYLDQTYIGHVVFIHDNLWGRIRPLAIIKKQAVGDDWIKVRDCEPDELGKTGFVYWPKIPGDQKHLVDCYVRFKVEPSQRSRDSDRDYDEYAVAENWSKGVKCRVQPLGIPILPEDHVSGPDRILCHKLCLKSLAPIYRWCRNGTSFDGPWQVAAELGGSHPLRLVPKGDWFVVEHAFGRLDSATYHIWGDKGESHAVLLIEPKITTGKIIDHLPASDLADWLIRVVKRDANSLLASLDHASPGWRRRVGELIQNAANPVLVKLEQNRFAKLEVALATLAANESQLADLIELPRFKEILTAAIGREVAVRRETIEADAKAESLYIVAAANQTRVEATKAAEREKQAIRREVEEIRAELSDIECLRDKARAQVEADKSSIRVTADYFVESRERIIRDFSVFHELIEKTRPSSDVLTNGHHPTVPLPTRIGVKPEGPAIDDPDIFLKERLVPMLANWGALALFDQAKRLHAALLACRWVVTPCPTWGVAYAEAMGLDARHRIVAVEPMWLAFSDAWSGEVETFWREAVERRDVLHLLIFADADRALAQCWARPLLDLISGLRHVLASGLPWPENLRVIASPAADEAVLPVPDWVVDHWAGVKPATKRTHPDPPIVPGHVPFATWSRWVMKPNDAPRPSIRFGVAARSAAIERSALAQIFDQLNPNGDPEEAEEFARQVREVDARSVFSKEARP